MKVALKERKQIRENPLDSRVKKQYGKKRQSQTAFTDVLISALNMPCITLNTIQERV